MIEHTYQELKVGQIGFVEKTITETDLYVYAGAVSYTHLDVYKRQPREC